MKKFIYRICIHFGFSTPHQLRLWYLRIFKQSYVVKMRLSRKGKCTQSGCALICCKNCPWLEHRGRLFFCKDHENAPMGCKEFPIDKKELDIRNKQLSRVAFGQCGFYWEEKKCDARIADTH